MTYAWAWLQQSCLPWACLFGSSTAKSTLDPAQHWLWLGQQALYVALLCILIFSVAIWRLLCPLLELNWILAANRPPRQLTVVRVYLGNSVSSRDTALPHVFNGLRCARMTWGSLSAKLTSAMLAPRWSIWACIWENSAKMMFFYCPENFLHL